MTLFTPNEYEAMTREQALAKIAEDICIAELETHPAKILAKRLGAAVLAEAKCPEVSETLEKYIGAANTILGATHSFREGVPFGAMVHAYLLNHYSPRFEATRLELIAIGVPLVPYEEQERKSEEADKKRAEGKGSDPLLDALDKIARRKS